jgi:hypothetical protein
VSPVALVHPVVVVSPVLDMLAVFRVVAVSPVLAMRWFSFVHEGFGVQFQAEGLWLEDPFIHHGEVLAHPKREISLNKDVAL